MTGLAPGGRPGKGRSDLKVPEGFATKGQMGRPWGGGGWRAEVEAPAGFLLAGYRGISTVGGHVRVRGCPESLTI